MSLVTIGAARVALRALLVSVTLAAAARSAAAQERLTGASTVTVGATFESWSFGRGGALQPGLGAADDARVRGAAQLTVPISVVVPLDARWTMDLATAYASGVVTLARDTAGGSRRYRLAGPTDVRLRAVGHLVGDAVLLTLGANLPTGRASLGAEPLGALRVLAAPALGLSTPAVGEGAGGTVGLVLARRVGSWALATGASYERRGAYRPITALAAGAATSDARLRFAPGEAVHLSLGTDRLVGQSRTTLGVTADVFGVDRLRIDSAGGDAAVRLGPVIGAEWRWQAAPAGLRELRARVSDRYRRPYARDGATVPGSAGNYLDADVGAVWPVTPTLGVLAAFDARHHTGLAVDHTFATARARAAGLTLGLAGDVAGYRIQPSLRAEYGTIETAERPTSARGFGASLTVSRSF